MNYANLIRRINELKSERGHHIQPPCPPAQLELLRARLRDELGCELPPGYEELLSLTNGLSWNGVLLFSAGYEATAGHGDFKSIEDIVFANVGYREGGGLDRMLIVGESGMDLYIHHLDDAHAAVIDKFGLHEYETFPSVRELVVSVLQNSLAIFDGGADP